MSKYGIELYSTLEAETGLATGWKQCGSVNVARTPERMQVLKKQAALARSFGVEVQRSAPKRGRRPVPGDAHRRPAGRDLDPRRRQGQPGRPVHVLAKGARNRGAKLVEGVEVTGVITSAAAWPACAPHRARCAARCWSTAPASGRGSSARWPA
jgi:glycine/D-amino acid oxidase-like deaminating enzyme